MMLFVLEKREKEEELEEFWVDAKKKKSSNGFLLTLAVFCKFTSTGVLANTFA